MIGNLRSIHVLTFWGVFQFSEQEVIWFILLELEAGREAFGFIKLEFASEWEAFEFILIKFRPGREAFRFILLDFEPEWEALEMASVELLPFLFFSAST